MERRYSKDVGHCPNTFFFFSYSSSSHWLGDFSFFVCVSFCSSFSSSCHDILSIKKETIWLRSAHQILNGRESKGRKLSQFYSYRMLQTFSGSISHTVESRNTENSNNQICILWRESEPKRCVEYYSGYKSRYQVGSNTRRQPNLAFCRARIFHFSLICYFVTRSKVYYT